MSRNFDTHPHLKHFPKPLSFPMIFDPADNVFKLFCLFSDIEPWGLRHTSWWSTCRCRAWRCTSRVGSQSSTVYTEVQSWEDSVSLFKFSFSLICNRLKLTFDSVSDVFLTFFYPRDHVLLFLFSHYHSLRTFNS